MSKKNIIIPITTFVVGMYFGFYLPHNNQTIISNERVPEQKKIEAPIPNEQQEAPTNPDTFPKIPTQQQVKVDSLGFPIIPNGPSKKYMEEAQEFLGSCPLSKDENDDCVQDQARFEQEYVNAYSGDYLAQSNIAYELWASPPGILRKNLRQACAWRLIIITSGSPYLADIDIERSKEICGDIDSRDPTVLSRAQAIRAVIRSKKVKPVAVPAIDYDPRRDKDETNAGG